MCCVVCEPLTKACCQHPNHHKQQGPDSSSAQDLCAQGQANRVHKQWHHSLQNTQELVIESSYRPLLLLLQAKERLQFEVMEPLFVLGSCMHTFSICMKDTDR